MPLSVRVGNAVGDVASAPPLQGDGGGGSSEVAPAQPQQQPQQPQQPQQRGLRRLGSSRFSTGPRQTSFRGLFSSIGRSSGHSCRSGSDRSLEDDTTAANTTSTAPMMEVSSSTAKQVEGFELPNWEQPHQVEASPSLARTKIQLKKSNSPRAAAAAAPPSSHQPTPTTPTSSATANPFQPQQQKPQTPQQKQQQQQQQQLQVPQRNMAVQSSVRSDDDQDMDDDEDEESDQITYQQKQQYLRQRQQQYEIEILQSQQKQQQLYEKQKFKEQQILQQRFHAPYSTGDNQDHTTKEEEPLRQALLRSKLEAESDTGKRRAAQRLELEQEQALLEMALQQSLKESRSQQELQFHAPQRINSHGQMRRSSSGHYAGDTLRSPPRVGLAPSPQQQQQQQHDPPMDSRMASLQRLNRMAPSRSSQNGGMPPPGGHCSSSSSMMNRSLSIDSGFGKRRRHEEGFHLNRTVLTSSTSSHDYYQHPNIRHAPQSTTSMMMSRSQSCEGEYGGYPDPRYRPGGRRASAGADGGSSKQNFAWNQGGGGGGGGPPTGPGGGFGDQRFVYRMGPHGKMNKVPAISHHSGSHIRMGSSSMMDVDDEMDRRREDEYYYQRERQHQQQQMRRMHQEQMKYDQQMTKLASSAYPSLLLRQQHEQPPPETEAQRLARLESEMIEQAMRLSMQDA